MRMREALGEVLRDVRFSQGRTLRDVAYRVPMSLGYLSEIERGHKEISSEILEDLAKALRVPVYQLILDAGYRLCDVPDFVPDTLELERV